MNNSNELQDLWTHSATYSAQFQARAEIAATLELLQIRDARSLLDVGCGNGSFALAAALAFPRCSCHACDALESAIAECRRRAAESRLTNLEAKVASADSLPYADGSFDRVLSRFLLHHIESPREVFGEMYRVLQPGGLLLLQTPFNAWEEGFAEVLRHVFFAMDASHARHYYTHEQICVDLENAGFKIASTDSEPFVLPFTETLMADAITQHGASDRLRLAQVSDGHWTIQLSWFRATARR